MTAEQYKDFERRIGNDEAEKLRAMATKLLNTEWRKARDETDGTWIDICPECQGKAAETETKAPAKPRGWNYPTEDQEQQAVIDWARMMTGKYPELELLHHIPNGGSRNKAEAAKFQRMGVKSGIPDLCLPVPKGLYHGLYIEMKRRVSWTLTDAQKDVISKLAAQGYYCEVCPGAEAAIKSITRICKEQGKKLYNYTQTTGGNKNGLDYKIISREYANRILDSPGEKYEPYGKFLVEEMIDEKPYGRR